jgi:serine/threonine protein kinase
VDELRSLLQSLAAAAGAVQAGIGIYGYMVGYLHKRGREKRTQEIKQWLEDLGCHSETAVRNLVEEWADNVPAITAAQREEVIGLLINLTRGARFLTTNGTVRSSYLRCEKLIDQLLANLQPVRKRGELVGQGINWELERFLGQGTFGEVWMARNREGYPKLWACKFFTREDAQEWIRKEKDNLTHILKRLGHHPHIVEFLYVAVDRMEWPFLALEYVGGGSLEDWILEDTSRRPKLDKYEIVRGIVLGLAEAHRQGIYHRDLKPANVLLTEGPDVQAKITDFGLAKVTVGGQTGVSSQVSQTIQVGTSMYLPPEAQQILVAREPAQDDVFALGVLWYQLVTERLERPPYDFAERLQEHQLDTHTIRIIARCLAHPNRRFRDACQLEEEMEFSVPPAWQVPSGLYDVQHIVREYLGSLAR